MSGQDVSDASSIDMPARRGERRGGTRRRADVAGELRAGAGGRPCRVTNFSTDGSAFAACDGVLGERLIVAGEPLERGAAVSIVLRDEAADVGCTLTGRLARVVRSGVGVQFESMPAEALALLEGSERALAMHDDAARRARAGGGVDPVLRATLLGEARDRTLGFVEGRLEKFGEAASERAATAMDDATSNAAKQACMDAMREVRVHAAAVVERFADKLSRRMLRSDSGAVASATTSATLLSSMTLDDLSLVDNESFDDWLVARNLAERAAAANRESLTRVELCAGNLFGEQVEGEQNPLSTETLCLAMHEAVEGHGFNSVARSSLYESFAALALDDLAPLHESLLALFETHGVRPERIRPAPGPGGQTTTSVATQTALGGATTIAAPGEATMPVPPGGMPPLAPLQGLDVMTAGRAGAAQFVAPDPESYQFQAAPPMVSPYQVQPYQYGPALGGQRAFGAARALRGVRRVADALRPGTDPATLRATMHAAASAPLAGYDGAQGAAFANVLSQLQADSGGDTLADAAAPLRERVREVLASDATVVDDADADALDVIASLIDNITADPLINSSDKSRIRRVALPLLQVALNDERVFDDANHPARQLIDQLGQLGLSSDDAVQGVLRTAVDPMVEALQADASAAGFGNALPRLQSAVMERQQAFEANVAEVVAERARQREVAAQMRGSREVRRRPPPPALAEWFDRARNLSEGDVLDLGEGEEARRGILAVKDEQEDAFVFVDGSGSKIASVTLQELALWLQRGRARRHDSARTPAFERGWLRLLEDMHGEVVEKVSVDELTGLATRDGFESFIDEALAAEPGLSGGASVTVVALHDFERIGERVGQRAVDALVKKVAGMLERIAGSQEGTSKVAHFGHGRFAVALVPAMSAQAKALAERVVRLVASANVKFKGDAIAMQARAGAVHSTLHLASGEALVDAAGDAATRAEPGQVLESDDATREVVEIDGFEALRSADRLCLRAQPVEPLDPDAKAKAHFEVHLAKLDEHGQVATGALEVRAAMRDGSIASVDRWVIERALNWMSANRRQVVKSGGYAIRLSGASLNDAELLGFVMEVFNRTRVPPGKVIFEVGETSAIDTLSNATAFIRTLREYGCRFALHDFGGRPASQAQLRQLPLDFVKIDAGYVREMLLKPSDLAMVKSINELGQVLGKLTVAGGAEDDATLEALREIGVNFAQGTAVGIPELMAAA